MTLSRTTIIRMTIGRMTTSRRTIIGITFIRMIADRMTICEITVVIVTVTEWPSSEQHSATQQNDIRQNDINFDIRTVNKPLCSTLPSAVQLNVVWLNVAAPSAWFYRCNINEAFQGLTLKKNGKRPLHSKPWFFFHRHRWWGEIS